MARYLFAILLTFLVIMVVGFVIHHNPAGPHPSECSLIYQGLERSWLDASWLKDTPDNRNIPNADVFAHYETFCLMEREAVRTKKGDQDPAVYNRIQNSHLLAYKNVCNFWPYHQHLKTPTLNTLRLWLDLIKIEANDPIYNPKLAVTGDAHTTTITLTVNLDFPYKQMFMITRVCPIAVSSDRWFTDCQITQFYQYTWTNHSYGYNSFDKNGLIVNSWSKSRH